MTGYAIGALVGGCIGASFILYQTDLIYRASVFEECWQTDFTSRSIAARLESRRARHHNKIVPNR